MHAALTSNVSAEQLHAGLHLLRIHDDLQRLDDLRVVCAVVQEGVNAPDAQLKASVTKNIDHIKLCSFNRK